MLCKCCRKAQFPHNFGQFSRNCAETAPLHKIFITKKLGVITVFYAACVPTFDDIVNHLNASLVGIQRLLNQEDSLDSILQDCDHTLDQINKNIPKIEDVLLIEIYTQLTELIIDLKKRLQEFTVHFRGEYCERDVKI